MRRNKAILFVVLMFFLVFGSLPAFAVDFAQCPSLDRGYRQRNWFPYRQLEVPVYAYFNNLDAERSFKIEQTSSWNRASHRTPHSENRDAQAEWFDIVRRQNLEIATGDRRYCVHETAVNIYHDLAAALEKNHPYLRRWVQNQERVFAGCSSGKDKPTEVTLLSAKNAPARAAADQEYQTASFYFYIGNYEIATRLYRQIYEQESHPYREYAAYMIGRIFRLRRNPSASYEWIAQISENPQFEKLRETFRDFRFVIAYYGCDYSKNASACKSMYLRHIKYIKENLTNIGQGMAAAQNYNASLSHLDRYLQRKPRIGGGFWFSPQNKTHPSLQAYAELAAQDEFFDWMQTNYTATPLAIDPAAYLYFSDQEKALNDAALNHALDRWKAGDGDEWLFTAYLRLYPGHADFLKAHEAVEHLLKEHVCASSYAGRNIFARLWRHYVVMDVATEMTDGMIQNIITMRRQYGQNVSIMNPMRAVLNLFLHQKRYEDIRRLAKAFIAAEDFDANLFSLYLNFFETPQKALSFLGQYFTKPHYYRPPTGFLTAILNRLSIEDIIDALNRYEYIPKEIKKSFLRTVFVRTVLLGDRGLFEKTAHLVVKTHPFLKPDIAAMLNMADGNPQSPYVTAFLLRHPRFNIVSTVFNQEGRNGLLFNQIDGRNRNDNNWWCRLDDDKLRRNFQQHLFHDFYNGYPALQGRHDAQWYEQYETAKERSAAEFFAAMPSGNWAADEELKQLEQYPAAPEYLPQQAAAYARSPVPLFYRGLKRLGIQVVGKDQMKPEMLHRAVMVTRYGCRGHYGKYSHEAFSILHRQYPASAWAEMTPYWFD
jgi:hypothetical protein